MAVTIVVEDGTGLTNSNSYISVADAATYFANLNNTDWANLDPTVQAAALVQATQDLDSWLRGRWKGRKKIPIVPTNPSSLSNPYAPNQALAWPREYVRDEDNILIDNSFVPQEVKWATAEIALLEAQGTSFIQQTVTKDDVVQSESVGSISVTYKQNAPSITIYPKIIQMLQGLANVGGIQMNIALGLTAEDRRRDDHNFSPFKFPQYFELIKGYGNGIPDYSDDSW